MNENLFNSIINTAQDCVFWKDTHRRFVGVNQAFLDFYGFASADVLIGKTDEDMGWHNDPEPYRRDELRVLSGESTYKVPGKCIIRGQERDIIASKKPLYENGKIIGLVGSFLDVTDTLRQHAGTIGHQKVYTAEQLRRHPYFDKLLVETSIGEITDPLTGILSRACSMDLVHSLIAKGIPFSFAIVDLDNFKLINDHFGHKAGDIVLKAVTKSLAEFMDGYGFVGRFGGDELLLINLRDLDYDALKAHLAQMYESGDILRQNIAFDEGNTHITATTGCAVYPKDADSFDTLFALIDKTLYIGKSKGRNCYIIYVKEKHESVELRNLAKNSIYADMHQLKKVFQRGKGLREKLLYVSPLLADILQVPDLFYVSKGGYMKSVRDPSYTANASDIDTLMTEDFFSTNNLLDLQKKCPVFYHELKEHGMESLMIIRVDGDNDVIRYIICAVQRSLRIWQDDECAIMYFLANLIAAYLRS